MMYKSKTKAAKNVMTQEAPFALECFPTRVLDFRLEDGANPVECVLHLTNKGTDPVAFKVKTTKPKRYLVRPNQGTVGPSTNINVSIVLLAPEKMELLREFRNSSGPTETNKFMVQALPLDAGANVAGVLTSDAWEQSRERVQQKRLVVKFSVPQAAGPWTKMARLKEASNEIREAVTGGSSLDGEGEAEGSRRQGTGVDAGNLSQDQMWEQAKALRQKYDDLVSFTINLTAEKDLIQKSLASTRGELQREQQARKQLEAQRKISLLPLMDPAARRASAVVGATTLGESHSGFSLFFVLLVAMIALFAGQYAAANGIADVFGK